MGCGGSKGMTVKTENVPPSKDDSETQQLTTSASDCDDLLVTSVESPPRSEYERAPPLSQDNRHNANMLLHDWTKSTEDSSHARILAARRRTSEPPSGATAKRRVRDGQVPRGRAGTTRATRASRRSSGSDSADGDADDSSDDDDRALPLASKGDGVGSLDHVNGIHTVAPGSVDEPTRPSLMHLFRPKSAVCLDLD
eukprot:m.151574 g.151574  ORF g.151574 m.151574 type:complete len:197 (+) comp17869_c0_seq7:352-942(+)